MNRITHASLLALALAACTGEPPAPEPSPTASGEPSAAPTNSIFDTEAGVEPAVAEPEPTEATIPFAEGGSELSAAALAKLDALLASDAAKSAGAIVVRGHSDAGGNDAINLRVSRERAEAVRDYLLEQGVAADRIEVIAFGEQNPVEPNALANGEPNEAGRQANRRVEITVALQQVEKTASPEPTNS
ncbi:OmpA family protein [Parerythrobacter lacustris]|uniref:OmpA family protein n=1 Tax=Parerythrobacter lacustris TaxID=2969984 RepID=A0ABT1XRP2_9SPHN|nr:OmpA family protein [Parerythrobacter lacustris]MCR2834320.1 OmpA family protein [Parerythrobacter lacustris]